MYKLMFVVCLFGACTMETASERLDGKTVQDELCATGCTTEVEEVLASPRQWEEVNEKIFVSADDEKLFDDPCAQLPADGICAFACDPEELKKHIPTGTCIDIRCELRDGRQIVAGGCAAP